VIAERVSIAPDAPEIGRFTHFHDVAELVLFNHVSGAFLADDQRHPLSDGALVFVPSMHHHDFALERGAMEWVLVQIDPYLVQALAVRPELARLARPFCSWPDDRSRARIELLSDWLVEATESGAGDPAVDRIVELLLIAAVEAPEREASADAGQSAHVERLLPVLERLRGAPADPIPLKSAATMCSLSPAYFSRRFQQIFGMTFTNYTRIYRLHLAARRLLTSGASISEIGYGVGFSSPAHFSARFRQRFGMTPREYRKSARTRAA
jgi:AraC-like DNA-binding protein